MSNTFTLENTADATHMYSATQLLKVAGNRYKYMNNHSGFEWYDGGVASHIHYRSLELSRPLGERKEDFLIPISYVKKFTPLVVGDVLFYNDGGYEFTLNDDKQAALYNDKDADEYYSLVSFSDRPNTGEQPVGDDVIVCGRFEAGTFSELQADYFDWSLDEVNPITSWKPNRPSMIKKYQAEQEHHEPTKDQIEAERPQEMNEEYLKTCSRDHLLMLAVDMLSQTKYQQGVIDELTGDSIASACEGKPVYTQATKDAGELPPVGSVVNLEVGMGPLHSGSKITYIGDGVGCYIAENGMEFTFSTESTRFYPIDNRTDEEKLRDAIRLCVAANPCEDLIVKLLSSDKFTITLNDQRVGE